MWCAKDKSLTYDEAKTDASKAKKDIKLVSVKCWIGFCCHIAVQSLGFTSPVQGAVKLATNREQQIQD